MTPPSPSARGTPVGHKIGDGYQTLVAFAGYTTIGFWERSVTPPSLDGGEPIDTTTMLNVTYRSMTARQLKSLGGFSMTAAWDPAVYSSAIAMINVPTTVTVHFPDSSSIAFYGYLRSFKPGAHEEGKMPEATLEVQPTNVDPVTCAPENPVFTAGSGTYAHC